MENRVTKGKTKGGGMQRNGFDRTSSILERLLSLAACALALALPVAAKAQALQNQVVWREGFVSSAQPGKAFLEDIKKQGFDMVINLAPPQSMGSIETEGGIVGSHGVLYVNIPVAFGKPTLADFKFFSSVMKAGEGKKILVHCQANLRGSSFSFLYRVTQEGAPVDETLSKLTGIWNPDPVWKKFVEDTLAVYGKKADIF
jgi:protein tyrosine phosphatase (PTP) superfamily phosphohydrolase (DUF442 family)